MKLTNRVDGGLIDGSCEGAAVTGGGEEAVY
jgi:hypothetical protein